MGRVNSTRHIHVNWGLPQIEDKLKEQGVTCPTALHLHTKYAMLLCPRNPELYRVAEGNPNANPINTMMG